MNQNNLTSSFLAAAQGKNSARIPVWLMRQAGRYLPEYQALRKEFDFRTLSHRPDLIAKTTLLPMKRYDMDAAILFSDILTSLEFMGAPFEFTDLGPKLADHGPHVLSRLTLLDPERHMNFVGEGIKETILGLNGKPLIGFVGGPFTLISYLIEGGTSREFGSTRRFMLAEPAKFKEALFLLSDSMANYLSFQIKSGVSAVQIFDSWVGFLSAQQYGEFILPAIRRITEKLKIHKVPIILYSQPTTHLLPDLIQTGASVLSVDWRSPLTSVAETVLKFKNHSDPSIAIQGNVDPLVTTLNWSEAKPHIERILQEASDAQILDRYIFNVGHGVTPETNPDTVDKIVEFVHNFRAKRHT